MDKFKIVISDCHLSAGRIFEGNLNPHEDFIFDEEMSEMFRFFCKGKYGKDPEGHPVDVELFINGDYFDFLNVPVDGEFVDVITEEIALFKCNAIIKGHPEVMAAIREFASHPGKKVTYMIGNHDAELFFPKVREMIIREWDPDGKFPSDKIEMIADRDRVNWEGGVEVHHGNQFEAVHVLNFEKPLLAEGNEKPVLNIPWGSFYVLKIVNRLKGERDYVDRVRPIKLYLLNGLFRDPIFTIKYAMLSAFYFLKTRFVYSPKRRSSLKVTAKIVKQEFNFFLDLEKEARDILDHKQDTRTVIFGHTHLPVNKIWPDGKQYINTGTWTRMIHLDWRRLGAQVNLTFAHVRIHDGPDGGKRAQCDLRQWEGEYSPHRVFHG